MIEQSLQENAAWHALEPDAAVARLKSDAAAGLSSAVAADRLQALGPNALPEPPKRSVLRVFLRQFKSPLIYILFVAAALAAAHGPLRRRGVILAVVLVNALIGAFQEGRAERSMAALRQLSALQVRVLRDGREQPIAGARAGARGHRCCSPPATRSAPTRACSRPHRSQRPKPRSPANRCPWPRTWRRCPRATGLADRRNMLYSGTHVTAGRGARAWWRPPARTPRSATSRA